MVDLFGTTRWSLIVAAGRDDSRAHSALAELCQAYWRPVYVFIRRKGHSTDDAADLTQGFFLHILEHHAIERADQSRGRFRSYLLTAVRNFLETARLRDVTLRRGAGAPHEAIETIDVERRPSLSARDHASSPERVFERHWALNLTERALESVRAEYASRGQERVFDELRPLLTSEAPASSPAGLDSTSAADAAHRTALHRARRRFGQALRAEIRETVNESGEVDEELRFLLRVLAD
ncbi:MAG TPA: sigma factor [Vicinamibacterales bacterium]|jgi:RNA polymerase sigma-70 factor (ECF subfamily)